MAFRQERLERIIERELGLILSMEVKDTRLKFVTVTKVSLTNDLSIATVYYTVMGDEEQRHTTEANLNDAKGFIRSSLGRKLEVRKIPELRFKYDESLDKGQKIEDILKQLKNHS